MGLFALMEGEIIYWILLVILLAIISSQYGKPQLLTSRKYNEMDKRHKSKYKPIRCNKCNNNIVYGEFMYINKNSRTVFECMYPRCNMKLD